MYVLMLKISEWSLPVANSTKTMLVYSAVYQEQFWVWPVLSYKYVPIDGLVAIQIKVWDGIVFILPASLNSIKMLGLHNKTYSSFNYGVQKVISAVIP